MSKPQWKPVQVSSIGRTTISHWVVAPSVDFIHYWAKLIPCKNSWFKPLSYSFLSHLQQPSSHHCRVSPVLKILYFHSNFLIFFTSFVLEVVGCLLLECSTISRNPALLSPPMNPIPPLVSLSHSHRHQGSKGQCPFLFLLALLCMAKPLPLAAIRLRPYRSTNLTTTISIPYPPFPLLSILP